MSPSTRLALWFAISACRRRSEAASMEARQWPKRKTLDTIDRCDRDARNLALLLVELRSAA